MLDIFSGQDPEEVNRHIDDWIKDTIDHQIAEYNVSEEIALCGEANDIMHSLEEREVIEILSDKYAAYDVLRRLAEMCKLINRGFDIRILYFLDTILDKEYIDNTKRIRLDKADIILEATANTENYIKSLTYSSDSPSDKPIDLAYQAKINMDGFDPAN